MRIAFLNPNLAHEYDAGTPFEHALAGSQSAECYLAIALAKRGHQVAMLNGSKQSRIVFGVRCGPLSQLGQVQQADAIFVLNSPGFARELRIKLGPEMPIICWEHNPWNPNAEYNRHLLHPQCARDRVLCVSDWQRDQFVASGGVPPDHVHVLRNAISPFFESLLSTEAPVFQRKAWPPVMAFTSTPFKGLKPALLFFNELRRCHASVTLNVFSSFDLYPPTNEHRLDRSWESLYDECRNSLGVNYIGNVSQSSLARTLNSTVALFFPSVLPETSSICIMEAMAAGCVVISSALGGLPEVMAGFGHQIELEEGRILNGRRFVQRALEVIDQFDRADPTLEKRLKEQIEFVRDHYRWDIRAAELEQILQSTLSGRA